MVSLVIVRVIFVVFGVIVGVFFDIMSTTSLVLLRVLSQMFLGIVF